MSKTEIKSSTNITVSGIGTWVLFITVIIAIWKWIIFG